MNSSRHLFRAMENKPGRDLFPRCTGLLLLLLFLCFVWSSAHSLETEEIRLQAGLSLFQSVLTADLDIRRKKGADGSLLLVLIYKDNKNSAKNIAQDLEDNGRIHGIPIRVEVTTDTSLEQYSKEPPAGIFLVQEINDNLERVINFGKLHKIIVFSPFEGDVEAGVLGGIHISERMLPYINQRTLDASGIKIKPFFLRVSKHYED